MAIFETKDGSVELADSLVEAVIWNAEFAASLAEMALNKIVPGGLHGTLCWPDSYLLEFGSVLQIAYWERQGISAHLDAGLPSYKAASCQLAERARKGPEEFAGDDATPLHKAVVLF